MHTTATAIIPARLGSTRLPGKVLLAATGRPLIVHVCERAAAAGSVGRVVVATDTAEIASAVGAAGYETVMTAADHPNGTSRVAEAASALGLGDGDAVVNVQGDEPEIEPEIIDAAASALDAPQWERDAGAGARGQDLRFATVASPFVEGEDWRSPNVVKVVTGVPEGQRQTATALYFSRATIPHDRDGEGDAARTALRPLKHIGIYAYTVATLRRYARELTPTPLERAEKLEQLRWLEHGHQMMVAIRTAAHHGIDTKSDYDAFVRRHAAVGGG